LSLGITATNENGGEHVRALELPDETKHALEELKALSERAEAGDKGARRELRLALRRSTPAVIARASDIGRKAQSMLIRTAAAGDPLVEEALKARLDVLRGEVAGEEPTPLEALLAERIVACWMLLELLEALHSAYFARGGGHERPSISYLLQMVKVQESAHRRLLASIQTLARVRKLQAVTPGIQLNTQINLR
jgi:hypothetical protein